MNNTALSKLDPFNRALIGFESMFDSIERKYANSASANYPPYNIVKVGENRYQIDIAVTGFTKDEVVATVEANELTVKGERNKDNQSSIEYLHRGLAMRDFERSFTLAEHMKVVSAAMSNGILHIEIEREIPESAKPKIIDIIEVN